MIVGCYTLDLYCDVTYRKHPWDYRFPHQFTGETFGECKKQAQRYGWIFHRNSTVTCPHCADLKSKASDGSSQKSNRSH